MTVITYASLDEGEVERAHVDVISMGVGPPLSSVTVGGVTIQTDDMSPWQFATVLRSWAREAERIAEQRGFVPFDDDADRRPMGHGT